MRYQITEKQHNDFQQNGHILLRNLATPEEIDTFQPAIRSASYKYSTETRSLEQRDTYGRAFLQIMNLWQQDEAVKRFVFEKKFAQVAADLLGVEKVRLYHDQALFKEPGGGYTPWHQDQYYWPLDTDKTITMWMALSDVKEDMGMVKFSSGSHKNGPIGNLEISDESEEVYEAYLKENGLSIIKADKMMAGDATFHLGWTIHGADANLSIDKTREAMTIIYFADGVKVSPLQNENQKNDLEAWLENRQPGEIADGNLNPVLN